MGNPGFDPGSSAFQADAFTRLACFPVLCIEKAPGLFQMLLANSAFTDFTTYQYLHDPLRHNDCSNDAHLLYAFRTLSIHPNNQSHLQIL